MPYLVYRFGSKTISLVDRLQILSFGEGRDQGFASCAKDILVKLMKKEALSDEEESIRACYVEFKEARDSMKATPLDVNYTSGPESPLDRIFACLPCAIRIHA